MLIAGFLDLKYESGAGNVVASTGGLTGFGTDEDWRDADVDLDATSSNVEDLAPAGNRLLHVQRDARAGNYWGREAVVHYQSRFL